VTKWLPSVLLVYAQVGYLGVLAAWARLAAPPPLDEPPAPAPPGLPSVSLVIAAHEEEAVIEAKVRNALALDFPRDRLEVIVCSDGSTDATVELAAAAGADLVLDLPRGGKIRAQDAGVERARGEIVAFSDANAQLDPTRCASWSRRSPIPASATSAGRSASSTRRGRTRRASTGATRWRCGPSSRGWRA
jgi:hypothetical protein